MGNIAWLASYPKSGNTWLRVFLENLIHPAQQPADINALRASLNGASRPLFDHWTGVAATSLPPAEVERLRPRVYRQLAAHTPRSLLVKIHDAYTLTAEGEALIPPEVTAGAIYLVRNPLDVAPSLAHHTNLSLDATIRAMADPAFAFSDPPGRPARMLPQRLLTWSAHVESWLDAPLPRFALIRYEDMLRAPATFGRIVALLGLDASRQQVRRACEHSSFAVLWAQETRAGFREKPPAMAHFFRRGTIGQWREELSPAQVRRLLADHARMMRRLGYLDQRGDPVF